VDFVCRDKRLIVEVDGGTHSETREVAYDERRTAYLARQGFRVHRIWNIYVFTNIDDVLDGILLELALTSPHPASLSLSHLLPRGEKGE
jgi:very-short-patch-repair endonuclease